MEAPEAQGEAPAPIDERLTALVERMFDRWVLYSNNLLPHDLNAQCPEQTVSLLFRQPGNGGCVVTE